MAGPQDIQRVPRGLLELLGMQSAGATPRELAPAVSPSIELMQFYALQQQISLGTTDATMAESDAIEFTVPANRLWLLMNAGAISSFIGAVSIACYIAITPPGGFRTPLATYREVTTDATTGFFPLAVYTAPYPRILLPGTVLGFYMAMLSAADLNVTFSAIVGQAG